MTINMTFNSYEEVVEFANKIAAGQTTVPAATSEVKVMPTSKKEEPKAAKEAPVPTAAEPTGEQEYTLEDVRATLGALQKAGKKEQVKEILQSFGAAKLPEVDPADYPALMQKAGELDA